MIKTPKRPRDLNQWAKRMVDIATGVASDREPTPEEQGKDPAAVSLGRRERRLKKPLIRCPRSGARGRIINHIHSHTSAASVKTPSAGQRTKSKI